MNIVDFNKYIRRSAKDNMNTKILEEIIQSRSNGKVYKASDMEAVTRRLLKETRYDNVSVVPVVSIAKQFEFDTYQRRLPWFLSGFIGINKKYQKRYKTDRIVCTNRKVNPYQQRFVIAHELAHFLFDYDHESVVYSNTYVKNSHGKESERRANAFAANLLMPKDIFIREYKRVAKINPDPIFVVESLVEIFKTPRKAVLKRMSEVEFPCRY